MNKSFDEKEEKEECLGHAEQSLERTAAEDAEDDGLVREEPCYDSNNSLAIDDDLKIPKQIFVFWEGNIILIT